MQSTNSLQMQLEEERFTTHVKKASVPLCVSQLLLPNNRRTHFTYLYMKVLINSSFMFQCSSFIPECEDDLKPKVGMTFEGLKAVEEFYKSCTSCGFWSSCWTAKKSWTMMWFGQSVSCAIGKDSGLRRARRLKFKARGPRLCDRWSQMVFYDGSSLLEHMNLYELLMFIPPCTGLL